MRTRKKTIPKLKRLNSLFFLPRKNYTPYCRKDKEVIGMSTTLELAMALVLVIIGRIVTMTSEKKGA